MVKANWTGGEGTTLGWREGTHGDYSKVGFVSIGEGAANVLVREP